MALPRHVFCDTSFFYACLDRGDANHDHATEMLAEAASSGTTFSTTWDVISETVTLLRYRRSFQSAVAFLTDIKPNVAIVPVSDGVRREAAEVFRRFGRDHRLSFCDAISFVVVTTLLRHLPCLTYDEDFRRLGLTVVTSV
jgi:predicted nucleic acid-binding protein